MAQGCTRLAATTITLLTLMTGVASAQQPIEGIGPQTRLTQIGNDGAAQFDALAPALAYNPDRDEFLAVWVGRSPGFDVEQEVFGMVLNGAGAPKGPVQAITSLKDDGNVSNAVGPRVIYAGAGATKRYVVTFTATVATPPAQSEVFGQIVDVAGTAVGAPKLISEFKNPADVTSQATLTYDSQRDQVRFAWLADTATAGNIEVRTERFPSDLTGAGFGPTTISNMTGAPGGANQPSVVYLPDPVDNYLFVWQGDEPATDGQFEVFAKRQTVNSLDTISQRAITATPDLNGDALDPAVTYDPVAQQILVAYVKADPALDGNEIFTRRLAVDLNPLAPEQRVSTMGPTGSAAYNAFDPSATFLPGASRFLVTWNGDNDVGGLVDNETERWGQALNAGGAELATDDFRISFAGPDGNPLNAAAVADVAAHPASGQWLAVFSADDGRPPLADGEFELYGRRIGENFDRDGDGATVPGDCDDANPGTHPGANDVFDNGIDEDCAGGDAQNPDRDGDGSPRPQDCDDANAQIRPGVTDVPNNEVDEDCAGGPRRTRPDVDIERSFSVFRGYTKVTRLRIKKLKPGMKVQLRCSGKGCPKPLRNNKVKRVTVKKAGTKDFTKLFKKAKLKPKAVIDVRVLQTGAIGRVDRFIIRKAKLPKREQRCLPPGVKKPQHC